MLFVTGACGLVYQQLWLRELSLVFGVTVYAAATVLAAFMAGLALGSWLSGRLVDRARRPLAWFGLCEALVGVAALLTPAAMRALEALYVAVAGGPDTPLAVLTVLRLILGFAVLLVPATLMGASMPIVIRAAVAHSREIGSRSAVLYSVNTTGAIFGTVVAGFFLIGEFGLWNTFLVAASGNLLVGVTAFGVSRVVPSAPLVRGPVEAAVSAPPDGNRRPTTRAQRAVLAVFVVSGFVTLALEIVWFRVLVLYLESNTYAFSAMLAMVLAGIALGSAAVAPFLRRRTDWYTALVVIEALLAIVALGSLALLAQSFEVRDLLPAGARSLTVIGSGLVVFPSAFLMGVAFPIGILLWVDTGDEDAADAGRRVGIFYAGNLVGAIAGSLAAGFLLVPWLGTRGSVVLLSALIIGSVLILVAADPVRSRIAVAGGACATFLVVLVGFVPDPYAAALEHHYLADRVEWSKEGVQATVSVNRDPAGDRIMFVDGLPQASTAEETVQEHRMLGTLPMVLHPDARDALVVGLGGGVTAGAVAAGDDARVLVVELSEEVIEGARFFRSVNNDVDRRDNVEFRVDDGRNFLLLTDKKYDVITADIIQPQHAGAGKVWSIQYWRLVRDALADNGMVVQWVGTDRSEAEYKMIVRSFLEVFPNATLWNGGEFLVGTKGPLTIDPDEMRDKLADPRFADARASVGLTSLEAVLGLYTAGPRELRSFAGAGPTLTDDRPRIEYFRSLPRNQPRIDVDRLRGDVTDVLR